jgi:hypothetical protein
MPNESAGLTDDFDDWHIPRNVESVPLVEFLTSGENALAVSLRRVILDTDQDEENYAAFGNTP